MSKGATGPRKRRFYSPEFKAEATREVLDGPRAVRSVAGEIGVDEGTLRKWVHDERRRRVEGGVPSAAREDAGQDDKARILGAPQFVVLLIPCSAAACGRGLATPA